MYVHSPCVNAGIAPISKRVPMTENDILLHSQEFNGASARGEHYDEQLEFIEPTSRPIKCTLLTTRQGDIDARAFVQVYVISYFFVDFFFGKEVNVGYFRTSFTDWYLIRSNKTNENFAQNFGPWFTLVKLPRDTKKASLRPSKSITMNPILPWYNIYIYGIYIIYIWASSLKTDRHLQTQTKDKQ